MRECGFLAYCCCLTVGKAEFCPTRAFIGLNYLFYRYRLFGAMDADDNSPGTVYNAISVTLLFGLNKGDQLVRWIALQLLWLG